MNETEVPAAKISERLLLFLVGAIQFVNILDFMMVMPLGPDFAVALGIPASHLGYIGGSYTAAAAIAGIIGSFFLDRFDRRNALALAMLGLVIGTASGSLATDLTTLMVARIVAGAFGGPATSLAISIVADVIPAERRGKAMGAVMGAFAVASVVGVPMGLELAQMGDWRTPFYAVAGIGFVVTVLSITLMPPMRLHLSRSGLPTPSPPFREILSQRAVLLSLTTTAVVMLSTFSVVPNLATFVQFNLGYPREQLGILYFVGGIVSFVATRLVGILVDRAGAPRTSTIGAALFAGTICVWIVLGGLGIPVMGMFVGIMLANAFRSVAMSALTSRVPRPVERARFMSMQSAVQHIAAALGSFFAASILVERPDHSLSGLDVVGMISIGLAVFQPLLLKLVETQVVASEARAKAEKAQLLEALAAVEPR